MGSDLAMEYGMTWIHCFASHGLEAAVESGRWEDMEEGEDGWTSGCGRGRE